MSRRVAREKAMQILFQWEVAQINIDDAINNVIKESEIGKESQEFAKSLVKGTIEKLEEIDAVIKNKALKWQPERIGNVEKSVLRIAVYELLYKDTPRAVIINEAVNLVKVFSTKEAASFVNAILDKVIIGEKG